MGGVEGSPISVGSRADPGLQSIESVVHIWQTLSVYAKGIKSFSPGLAELARLPWVTPQTRPTLKELNPTSAKRPLNSDLPIADLHPPPPPTNCAT
jgi:hypothetical protein